MKNKIIVIMMYMLFLTGCVGNPVKTKSVSVSAPVLVNGYLKSVDVESDDSHNIKPSTHICSAWSFQVDTSSIAESIENSLKSSFTDAGNSPIFEITVNVEQDLDLTVQKGFYSATAEGEAEINASVTVRKDGKHFYRRTYNVSSDEDMGVACSEAITPLVKAVKKSTKKLVVQIVEDLEREASRR